MLATGRLYDPGAGLYRRPGQGIPMSLEHTSPIPEQYENASQSARRATSGSELESKTSTSHRKRVPVACERCRKRKIKCSGDDGDGSGCVNCKNAGWDGCQFLRVQSWTAPIHPGSGSGRHWQMSSRYHPYSGTSNRSITQMPNHHTNIHQHGLSYTPWANSLEYGGFTPSETPVSWGRNVYANQYPVYESETTSPYQNQTPSYMLPDPGPIPPANMNYVNNVHRAAQNTMWTEHMNSVSVPQQNSQTLTTSYPLTPIESHNSYQSTNVPLGMSHTSDRTLPTPGTVRPLPSVPSTMSDTPPPSALSHRSSSGWQTETASNLSGGSSSTNYSNGQDVVNNRFNALCASQNMHYPCVLTNQTSQVAILPSVKDIASDSQQPPTIHHVSLLQSQRCRTTSRESLKVSSPDRASIQYGYASAGGKGRRTHLGNIPRPLVNGTTSYTWSSSAAPSCKESLTDAVEADLSEHQNESKRTSLASLNNSSAYGCGISCLTSMEPATNPLTCSVREV